MHRVDRVDLPPKSGMKILKEGLQQIIDSFLPGLRQRGAR